MLNYIHPHSGLIIYTQSERTLDPVHSFYMEYPNVVDKDNNEYVINPELLFQIRHPDMSNMIAKMGESNFFSLHRVFLSYYEASTILRDFWNHYVGDRIIIKDKQIDIKHIEELVTAYKVPIFNSQTLNKANHILNQKKKRAMEIDPFQEYLWATQMSELLQFYDLSPFSKPYLMNRSIFESSYIFKGAMMKKEISVVLYEWANIYSYKQADFIKRISNILETIKWDIARNQDRYDQLSKTPEINQLVYWLDKQIHSNNHYKQCFFGVFNASDLLGAYSRHGSSQINGIKGINKVEDLSCKDIITSWRDDHLLPSDEQFMKLFKLWYFTTSYLLINWIRLPHFTNETSD